MMAIIKVEFYFRHTYWIKVAIEHFVTCSSIECMVNRIRLGYRKLSCVLLLTIQFLRV